MLPELEELCTLLASAATELDQSGSWPSQQLNWLRQAGVFRWFLPQEFGGWGWSEEEILEGYLALSQSCLTTTFVLTQWHAACRRLLACDNDDLRHELLPRLASGEVLATVGISHLSTSRQHIGQPCLTARADHDGAFLLDGFSPWVTGGAWADMLVLGATLEDGRQILAAVPRQRGGVQARPGARLLALTASCTDQVLLANVPVDQHELLAGPVANVMQSGSGGGAGGLQTSTLAIGLALAAASYLRAQAELRPPLATVADKLEHDCHALRECLRELTRGGQPMSQSDLRIQANSLVLRTTQAALQAAKGAGFVDTHPTGRWAREALFFLVWSCPQPVAQANLCELAQLN